MRKIEIKNLEISYKVITPFSIRKSLFSLKKSGIKNIDAIRGIDFYADKGEVVGLIGGNGSGKSTLLKCIAGVFCADKGYVNVFSNKVSLLSLGVGFNKELTGRENIYISGLLMGYSRNEISRKEQEIIEFSELGDFINLPVKSYSSGMYSKLSFAISAILESDIILIDEVFSVGDVKFKQKSANKMKEIMMDKSKTIIIVSHSMNIIKEHCNRVVWLQNGKIIMDGNPIEVVSEYEKK